MLNFELQLVRWSGLGEAQRRQMLRRPASRQPDMKASVSGIIEQVQTSGDAAIRELTLSAMWRSPDRWELTSDPT